MVRIKNALAGILHISAANLRLQGRAVADVPEITPDIQKQIDAGRIAVVTDEEAAEAPVAPVDPPAGPAAVPSAAPSATLPSELDALDETDAVEYIEVESDPDVIQSFLREEERPGVIDALRARLKEIEDAGQ